MRDFVIAVLLIIGGASVGSGIHAIVTPSYEDGYRDGVFETSRVWTGHLCEMGVYECDKMDELMKEIEGIFGNE